MTDNANKVLTARMGKTNGSIVVIANERTEILNKYFHSQTMWIKKLTTVEMKKFLKVSYPQIGHALIGHYANASQGDMRQAKIMADFLGTLASPKDIDGHTYFDTMKLFAGGPDRQKVTVDPSILRWAIHNHQNIMGNNISVHANFLENLLNADTLMTSGIDYAGDIASLAVGTHGGGRHVKLVYPPTNKPKRTPSLRAITDYMEQQLGGMKRKATGPSCEPAAKRPNTGTQQPTEMSSLLLSVWHISGFLK